MKKRKNCRSIKIPIFLYIFFTNNLPTNYESFHGRNSLNPKVGDIKIIRPSGTKFYINKWHVMIIFCYSDQFPRRAGGSSQSEFAKSAILWVQLIHMILYYSIDQSSADMSANDIFFYWRLPIIVNRWIYILSYRNNMQVYT